MLGADAFALLSGALGLKNETRYPRPMIDAALLSQIRTLSAVDRTELLGAVWESFTPEEAPVTEEEQQLLEARLADLREKPNDQSPWREVQARMRSRLP